MQNDHRREKVTDTILNKDRTADIEVSLKQGEEQVRSIMSEVEKKIKQGQERLKNVATGVDKQLHENPWPIVAGVAVGCVLLGYLMGVNKKN